MHKESPPKTTVSAGILTTLTSTTATIPVYNCPPGQELTRVSCQICPKNSFKKGTNSEQCKPCPDDENGRPGYTDTAGSSKCLYVSFQ